MNKEKIAALIAALKREYPGAKCSLEYAHDYQLLIAARLSAQCTDERVNMVTPRLFERFSSLSEFADADVGEIEALISSCGLYRTKARDIKGICTRLLDAYGGHMPDSIDELLTLPGVGRKTANLIIGDVFGKPSVVTDTHCIRLANRLGIVASSNPHKVEDTLRAALPEDEQSLFCHRLVLHGREVCTARKPQCDGCRLSGLCQKKGVKQTGK